MEKNKEIKVIELFAGIGSPRTALIEEQIKHKLIGFSEIDPHATASYCKMYGEKIETNLGDICDIKEIPKDIDLVFHGSPCQDFSLAGKQAGGEQHSGTRSSLLWETIRLVEEAKPKVVIWENVPNVIGKKNIKIFDQYLEHLEGIGYKNSYKVFNAMEAGVPQNRKRIFVVSSLSEKFDFENIKSEKLKKLEDYIDFDDTENCLSDERIEKIKGWKAFEKPLEKIITRESEYIPTITTRGNGIMTSSIKLIQTKKGIRPITTLECFKLMGFSKEQHDKAAEVSSKNQLYKQAGNSIVVDVLRLIFRELYKGE